MLSFWEGTPGWTCRSGCSCPHSPSSQQQPLVCWLCQAAECLWLQTAGEQHQAPRDTFLLLDHPWRRLVTPAHIEVLLARLGCATYGSHSWVCLQVGNIITMLRTIDTDVWERKEIKILCKANAARLANLFYPESSNASSVEPELLTGPSLQNTRTQTWTHLTHELYLGAGVILFLFYIKEMKAQGLVQRHKKTSWEKAAKGHGLLIFQATT